MDKLQYQIPSSIGTGYLAVPEFISQAILDSISDADYGQSGVVDLLETGDLKYPFVEIRIYNHDNHPDIITKLRACRIPFHFNYTYQEDMEVEYWQGLNKATEDCMLGFDTVTPESKRPDTYLDVDWLNGYLTNINAQLTLLGGNVEDLLDARNMYDPDK